MVAERLSADEYFNFLNNNVESAEQTLDSVEEYLENSKCVKVKVRLCAHVSFWKRIGASQFIVDTISHGYIIPFLTTPLEHVLKTINLHLNTVNSLTVQLHI